MTQSDGLAEQDLFVSGQNGYARYRIPALLTTLSGVILAFCEARKYTGRDSDQIDLMLRRSLDSGTSFEPRQCVATLDGWVSGNPAPVQDRDTGRIWLPFCRNLADGDETMICQGLAPRTVWVTYSDDDGASWAAPREITHEVKADDWSWYATGPCHGIQLSPGRLVVPCDHIVLQDRSRGDPHHSHVIYSDDHGETWHVGGRADEGTNECTVAELADGRLYLNCRNKRAPTGGGNHRAIAYSEDGGLTFGPVVRDPALPEPICQASCLCLPSGGGAADLLLFSNPATLDGRHHLTVRASYDLGRTWPTHRTLHVGPSAYSDLCLAGDGSICCFYERGDAEPYERLTLARFALGWLTAASG